AETQAENAQRLLTTLAQRRERLDSEAASLTAPTSDQIQTISDQLAQEQLDLAERESTLTRLRGVVESLQERHRIAGDRWQQASLALADREARAQALAALQAKIDANKNTAEWLRAHGLERARRLYHEIDIEPGWEDALEAVLRERLNAFELATLDVAL